tara:strand:- start:575 stop:1477 length:903 start_codon:yes stop_codon:yes gene_type:complete
MNISIIIVNYNVKEYIISCIESIYKHSKSDLTFEIIVVDNNSKDGSRSELKNNFTNISLIENNYNAGFSVAVNQGVRKSIGKYVFLLNPDTLFIEDSLYKLYNAAEKNDKKGAIGPELISNNAVRQKSFWRDPTLISTILSVTHLDFLNYKKNYKDKVLEKQALVDTISGGAFFISREIFNKLNGLNPNLFWMEDIDFCIRLRNAGYYVYFFPLTKIIHFIGRSAKKNFKVAVSNQLLSKIKFFKKNHSFLKYLIILLIIFLVSLVKTALFGICGLFSAIHKKKFLAYFNTLQLIISKRY